MMHFFPALNMVAFSPSSAFSIFSLNRTIISIHLIFIDFYNMALRSMKFRSVRNEYQWGHKFKWPYAELNCGLIGVNDAFCH